MSEATLRPLARLRPLPAQPTGARAVPLDHPGPARPHRVYVALTNHCNRSCPWCSTYSSPQGRTFLPEGKLASLLPADRSFELQLEGGEPMLHPNFWSMVEKARSRPGLSRLVIATNGTCLPRQPERLDEVLQRLGSPLTIKLSYNHHLRDHDQGLLTLATMLRERMQGPADVLVLNVRLRKRTRPGGGGEVDDCVREDVVRAGLVDVANIFYLERYGLASDETDWAVPLPVWGDFTLTNPDGSSWGIDLLARSAAMGRLP